MSRTNFATSSLEQDAQSVLFPTNQLQTKILGQYYHLVSVPGTCRCFSSFCQSMYVGICHFGLFSPLSYITQSFSSKSSHLFPIGQGSLHPLSMSPTWALWVIFLPSVQ